MPILRSTRSRKIQQEENIENNQNLSGEKKLTKKQQAAKENTRAGRASKTKRQPLKEIDSDKKVQQTSKNSAANEVHKSKMIHNEDNEQQTDAAKENIPESGEVKNNTTEKEEQIPEHVEPMEVVDSTEDNIAICSPNKKQKMNDDDKAEESETDGEPPKKDAQVTDENSKTLEPVKETEQENEIKQDDEKKKVATGINKNKSISLKSQSNTSKDAENSSSTGSNLPKQLLNVISNLYLNVGDRLHLDSPPRCLDDLAYCHHNHYRSELPEAPMTSQAQSLRTSLQHYRYALFINSTTDMCHRGEFPGKGIFTKIIELVLSINYKQSNGNIIAIYQQSYHKSIDLFSKIVRTFPPCWHKMRPYYVGFLEYGLDLAKLKNNKESISKSAKIFDIILDLLEDALKNADPEDLKKPKSEPLNVRNIMPCPNVEAMNSADLSMSSEYWNQNEYEERERQKQTFDVLPMDQKLERVFMALRLLLQLLENDLAMWMLHHNKKTKEWIFCSENRPLIVVLCELTQYTRMTRVARRIFSVYSEAASKGLCKKRLGVLERIISLLMVASNTADMENTAIGVKYPFLGEQTKTLIHEFFKIFKAHNREEISKYMETIELLRIPYVRYEFIDNVLIMFQFTNSEPLTPQKIALDIAKKRWLKYKPADELSNPDEYLSREQYLHLLLDAFRNYNDFHGCKTFLHVITGTTEISPLTTTNDSIHRWPTHGSGVLVLEKMAKDIKLLEGKLKMTVRMSKPKVDLPLADICIDEAIILKYRNDLKFAVSLQNVLLKQKEAYPDVDFSKWLEFLSDFSPKKLVKVD